ncbi:hypothetical protein V5799_025056 [Amblyomma americanum]|uniref:Uncharacterized protein n=1 Tax=Amblyomma americanum TaxID=6943 RepID=A0AAQ4EA98_AMBAM
MPGSAKAFPFPTNQFLDKPPHTQKEQEKVASSGGALCVRTDNSTDRPPVSRQFVPQRPLIERTALLARNSARQT